MKPKFDCESIFIISYFEKLFIIIYEILVFIKDYYIEFKGSKNIYDFYSLAFIIIYNNIAKGYVMVF